MSLHACRSCRLDAIHARQLVSAIKADDPSNHVTVRGIWNLRMASRQYGGSGSGRSGSSSGRAMSAIAHRRS